MVAVIVILSVLAVTAAPKFIYMSEDAEKAALNKLSMAINSAVILTKAKYEISGGIGDKVGNIDVYEGYPTSLGIDDAIDADKSVKGDFYIDRGTDAKLGYIQFFIRDGIQKHCVRYHFRDRIFNPGNRVFSEVTQCTKYSNI